jgi:hypothetical protein
MPDALPFTLAALALLGCHAWHAYTAARTPHPDDVLRRFLKGPTR